ncbi:MAG: DUF565 domain-containing protein [Cyanobacteria bacterium K_DeepCast_35m_m2_023]|nr:DUF565 domain-containing protein [Cyanobacteria bacterium K_DeepCast_35m_m2_023]
MTRLPLQQTRYNRCLATLGQSVGGLVGRNWRQSSLLILAMLLGYYIGSNLTVYVNARIPGGRPAAVLLMVAVVELLIRLRSRLVQGRPSLAWMLTDNLRMGAVYSVVLDAFKIGT